MHDELEQETGLDTMTKAELKAEARARGLSTSGTKSALLERLEQHDGNGETARGNGADEDTAEPSAEADQEEGGDEPEPQSSSENDEDTEEPESEPSTQDREDTEEPEPEPSAQHDEASADVAQEEPESSADDDGEAREAEPAAQGQDEDEDEEPEAAADDRPDGDRPAPALTEVAVGAAESLTALTGRAVDAVSGVRDSDDGYIVTIEVLELSRVPSTTDVLATYEVHARGDGAVTGYSRVHRYYRNQTTRD
jgi:hypothetical protein